MMFWYGIEQLFLNKYLGTASARAYLTMVYAATVLLFDIPGGILADKIGRKRTVLISCVVEILSVVILGMSTNLWQYLVGSILFGVFISLINGAAEALLYDKLKADGHAKQYAKQQGQINAYFLVGAAIANLLSGFIAQHANLRLPYFLSAIPGVIAFLLLARIVEAPREKAADHWYSHLNEAGRYILKRPLILIFGLQFVIGEVVFLTIGEFGQIYLLQFHISAVTLGILWSLVALAAALGRVLAHRGQQYPRTVILAYCVAIASFIVTKSAWGILLFMLVYGLTEALGNIAETEVQHASESRIRATLFSCVSFGGNFIGVPAVFLYNRIYTHHSLAAANHALGIIVIGLLLLTALASTQHLSRRAVAEAILAPLDKHY